MRHSPLHDYRILVTGGTSGLGRALVAGLLARGARVAFVARHADAVERTVTALPGSRGITGDVARKDDIYPIALQALGVLGGVDVLINNASSLGPVPLAPLADTSCEDLELALVTNLVGPFRLTKALLGSLAASARDGRHPLVVNISSDAAITPYANWGAYGASKAALQHLSRIWDQELLAEHVRILSIDPGDMDTPLHALAVPDADRTALKPPEAAAHEIAELIVSQIIERSQAALAASPESAPRAAAVAS